MAKKKKYAYIDDSDGTKYKFRFGTNAIVAVQDALKKPIGEIFDEFQDERKVDMKTIRTIVQVAAEDPKLSADEAGDLIDDVGLTTVLGMLGSVFGGNEGNTNPPAPSSPDLPPSA